MTCRQYADGDPVHFGKADPSPDARFYAQPRRVVHIDDGAIRALTAVYRELLPAGGAILDLMSSWRSHLPGEIRYTRVAGLGLNAEEMADNPQLTEYAVHDLNADPTLPYRAGEFDAACCAVSVQYLQHPVQVFRETRACVETGRRLRRQLQQPLLPQQSGEPVAADERRGAQPVCGGLFCGRGELVAPDAAQLHDDEGATYWRGFSLRRVGLCHHTLISSRQFGLCRGRLRNAQLWVALGPDQLLIGSLYQ